MSDVARDGRVRKAGPAAQLARQLHALVQSAAEPGIAQALVDLPLQVADRRPRRFRPAGDQIDRPPVQVVLDERDVESRGQQPVAQCFGRRGQLLLLERRGLAPLEEARPGRADHVDLGAAREVEKEAALDAGTRP